MKTITEPQNLIELAKKLRDDDQPSRDGMILFDHFIENKARRNYIPLTGSFELTPLCNLDCKMCYVHLNNSQFTSSHLLSIDTWKDLISQAYESGMRNASLTGGECLTYPGFKDVYEFLYSLGIKPGILSNGILINGKMVDFFQIHPPKMIQISLYGSSDDAYEKVKRSDRK